MNPCLHVLPSQHSIPVCWLCNSVHSAFFSTLCTTVHAVKRCLLPCSPAPRLLSLCIHARTLYILYPLGCFCTSLLTSICISVCACCERLNISMCLILVYWYMNNLEKGFWACCVPGHTIIKSVIALPHNESRSLWLIQGTTAMHMALANVSIHLSSGLVPLLSVCLGLICTRLNNHHPSDSMSSISICP